MPAAYGLDNGAAQKIMVYDLGGGTFDVSIIEIGDGVIEVLATNGDNHLGGDDFDERIMKYVLNDIKTKFGADLSRNMAAIQRIKEAAEQAKKELSSAVTTSINLPYLAENRGQMIHYETTLSRAKFEELIHDLIERTAVPVQNALDDAGIAPSELGKVLLVGGSTRIPAVQDRVRMMTGIEPSKNINPDECVAQGAAIQGDTLSGGKMELAGTTGGILLLDVTPLSLSIETVGGVATRLVERNSTLPIHYSQVFSTVAPFQSSVDIHVLQGERPMAADNKTIGKFRLNGIKRAPAGVPKIEVTFDIDANGILTVSARDLDTGKQQSITITANDRMSDAEINAAIHDAEAYAAQDQFRRDTFTALSEAGSLIGKVDNALHNAPKDFDKDEKKRVKSDLDELRKLATRLKPDKMTEADLADLRRAMQTLESSSENIRRAAGVL